MRYSLQNIYVVITCILERIWNSLPAHLRDNSLFHLLSATSKPFSSLSTRLAHAARLGFFLQKRAIYIFTVFTAIIISYSGIRRFDRRKCSSSSIYRRWHCAENLSGKYKNIDVEKELWTLGIE